MSFRFSGAVYDTSGRTVAVQPGLQIVVWMFFCVTLEYVEPGVHLGSGSWPTATQWVGTVPVIVLGVINATSPMSDAAMIARTAGLTCTTLRVCACGGRVGRASYSLSINYVYDPANKKNGRCRPLHKVVYMTSSPE